MFAERRRPLLSPPFLPACLFLGPVVLPPFLPACLFFGPVVMLPLLFVVLPLLPRTPLARVLPLLPRTPLPRAVVVLPPNTFLFEFAHDALVLKQSVQNFARREAASFLQCGLLHLLLALVFVSIMAATGELKRGRYLGRNGYGNSCGTTCLTMKRFLHLIGHSFVSIVAATCVLKRGRYSGRNGYGVSCGTTCLTMTRFLHLIGHLSNCVQYPYEYANPGKCKPWTTGFRYCPPVLVLMCCCWFCFFLFLCDF